MNSNPLKSENVCEENVYQEVFKSLSKSLRDFLYYKCGSLETANDLVQEAFIKLWQKCQDVPLSKAKSFLFTTGNNLFLNTVKSQQVRLRFKAENKNSAENKEHPEFEMEMKEFQNSLEAAINALPEGQKEVFLLNRINKMTYREIAESLGVSQKAIEKRMSKALIKLKDVLNPKD